MRDVYDFAKFFIKNGADSSPNTYDGNMKLQKLLVFAALATTAHSRRTENHSGSGQLSFRAWHL